MRDAVGAVGLFDCPRAKVAAGLQANNIKPSKLVCVSLRVKFISHAFKIC